MFVGSVERGCRTLAVGAMELPWVLIGGRPPIAPTGLLPSAPQKGAVHCVYSAMELSYFLIDAFINQSTYLAQFDTLNLNRQFVNSLVNRLILFFQVF